MIKEIRPPCNHNSTVLRVIYNHIDKLYELLDYFMNQPKGHRGEQGDIEHQE